MNDAKEVLVPVVYVGKKPQAFDNMARTGKVWKGAGDVQYVRADQARILMRFPDQWAMAEGSGAIPDAAADVGADPSQKPAEHMTKDELIALARARYGKKLDRRLSVRTMIDQMQDWEENGAIPDAAADVAVVE
ncbi:MAG: hypothetical protein IJS87_02450 [Rhodocyclaceae bacterium]|nr:hypothetical protein [Rhodocyclaceae bacterium]